MHETAFDAHPEITNMVVDDHRAAMEMEFVGTHTGDPRTALFRIATARFRSRLSVPAAV